MGAPPPLVERAMEKVLWIGVGNMGFPISMNLLKAGYDVAVFDTSQTAVDRAVRGGARALASLESGANEAGFIFTMLPNSEILMDVVLGERGLAAFLRPGQTVIDMSTVSVPASRACNDAIASRHAFFLRCPVNGSTLFAETAELTVISSGPEAAYRNALPLLEKISKTRHYLGDGDKSRLMKLAVNLMIGVTLEMFAEAAVLCEKGGIDWNAALDVFDGSSIASPQLRFKLPRLRKRDFTPASFTRTMVKDFNLILAAARECGVYAPVAAAAAQVFDACNARGHAEEDFSVVLETIEAMSGL
jgi:3-hydroxyisobutyrate dehydrogenase